MESVLLLLGAGASVHTRGERGSTALMWSVSSLTPYVRRMADRVVEALLDAGANVAARDDEGNTPLHYVARWYPIDSFYGAAKLATARRLLRSGAGAAARNNAGRTPAECVRARGHDVDQNRGHDDVDQNCDACGASELSGITAHFSVELYRLLREAEAAAAAQERR